MDMGEIPGLGASGQPRIMPDGVGRLGRAALDALWPSSGHSRQTADGSDWTPPWLAGAGRADGVRAITTPAKNGARAPRHSTCLGKYVY